MKRPGQKRALGLVGKSIRIPPHVAEAAFEWAYDERRQTFSDYVRTLIEEDLRRVGKLPELGKAG